VSDSASGIAGAVIFPLSIQNIIKNIPGIASAQPKIEIFYLTKQLERKYKNISEQFM